MKIAIDAAEANGRGGIATYTENLLLALLERNAREANSSARDRYVLLTLLHEFRRTIFQGMKRSARALEIPAYIPYALLPIKNLGSVNDALVRTAAYAIGADVLHFTNPLNFTPGPKRTVVTIHDLAPLHKAEWVKENSEKVFRQKIDSILSQADTLIAVSEYTKKDMVERFSISPEKVHVVLEAPRPLFAPDSDVGAALALTKTDRFILCVGQLQPRKNCIRLVDAFSQVVRADKSLILVFVGSVRDAGYDLELKEKIRLHGIQDRVLFLSSIDNAMLTKLYSAALCVAYPSLFEGFGLPVIEALACGAAVVASNTTSIPEVAGDAAVLVDPLDVQSLANGLSRVVSDPLFREDLKEKALKQAARFSWKKAAEETHAVYEYVCTST